MGIQKYRRPLSTPSGTDSTISQRLSTAERDTGLRDLAGAIVWEKTVAIAAGPNASTVNTAHSITGLLKVKSYDCMGDDGTTQVPAPHPQPTSAESLEVSFTDTNIVLISGTGGDYSSHAFEMTMRYTRS
jgi:hypothetical protein